MKKERLDTLVQRQANVSRSKAQGLIHTGHVYLPDGTRAEKPGIRLDPDTALDIKEGARFVSRGGEKLEGALRDFGVDVSGVTAIDVGASTGGFTDCLLQHGATKVFAVDVGYGQLHQRLAEYDFVVVAAPLTPATEGLFDAAAFAAMAPEARFINIGRGPIVRTDDLVAALREGQIAGAALDVFEEEPLPANHPLWDLPNTHLSAHMAGDVSGWRRALSEQFIDNFRRWRRGDPLRNLVDKEQGFVPSA